MEQIKIFFYDLDEGAHQKVSVSVQFFEEIMGSCIYIRVLLFCFIVVFIGTALLLYENRAVRYYVQHEFRVGFPADNGTHWREYPITRQTGAVLFSPRPDYRVVRRIS